MHPQMLKLMFFGVLVLAVNLSGCKGTNSRPKGPDLVPVKALGDTSDPMFCERDEAGHILIYVKNQGNADAISSAVEVEFFLGQGVSVNIGGQQETGVLLQGGTSQPISVTIPDGCWNADCDFKITVDILNKVEETNEQNNSVEGRCIG